MQLIALLLIVAIPEESYPRYSNLRNPLKSLSATLSSLIIPIIPHII